MYFTVPTKFNSKNTPLLYPGTSVPTLTNELYESSLPSLIQPTDKGASTLISQARSAAMREEGGSAYMQPNKISLLHSLVIKTYVFLNGKYLLDNLYNNYIISSGLKTGYTISKLLDKGIIELIGPFGLTEGSYLASYNLSKLDTGVITTYALYITLGLISILFIIFFS